MFKLFSSGKNTVKTPRILFCVIGHDAGNVAHLEQDRTIYQPYQSVTEYHAASIFDFFTFISGKTYDVVHLLVHFESEGTIAGKPGIHLLEALSKAGTKVVVFASDNMMESYVAAFPAAQRRGWDTMNMVLTFERKEDNFPIFFKALFDLMAKGKTMPMAWASLVPQANGPWMEKMPGTVFEANRGQVKLIP